jgi:hypothetical protein
MPLPVIENVYRCSLKGSWDSGARHTVNVIHVEKADPAATTHDVADVIDAALSDAGSDQMFGSSNSGWSLDDFDLIPLDGSSTGTTRTNETNDWPPGNVGAAPVPQVCTLIKLTTAKRGRSYRGRVYCGPISEGSMADGLVDTTIRDQMTAAWVNFANQLEGGATEVGLVVASYRHHTAEPVTNLAAQSLTATQRRRQKR